jgi:hypothetical protein
MQMQPGLIEPQPQDVVVVGVLLRLSHCGRDLFERLAPLSEEEQVERRECAGEFILDPRIRIDSGREPLRTDLEREPPRLAVFSGHPPNEA